MIWLAINMYSKRQRHFTPYVNIKPGRCGQTGAKEIFEIRNFALRGDSAASFVRRELLARLESTRVESINKESNLRCRAIDRLYVAGWSGRSDLPGLDSNRSGRRQQTLATVSHRSVPRAAFSRKIIPFLARATQQKKPN